MTVTDHADTVVRRKLRFTSGDSDCAAWHYPGTNGACVVMAGGFAVTKEPGTDRFARRFHAAGFSVLAFDYRRIGESGGQPRQVLPIGDQLADWQAAIDVAAALPEVDSSKVAIWGFSASGGHVFRVAARNPRVAAAIAQTPNADNLAAARNASRHQKPLALLRFTGRGILDSLGGLVGRPPRVIPLVGEPGTVAMLTTPDALDTERALDPDHRYPEWRREVAARSALRLALYRPARGRPGAAGGVRPAARRALRTVPRSARADRRGRVGVPAPECPRRAIRLSRCAQLTLSSVHPPALAVFRGSLPAPLVGGLPQSARTSDTDVVTSDAGERSLLPISCALGPTDGAARLEEWRRITAAAGLGRIAAPGQVTMRFRSGSGVEKELQRLVAAERDCCAFLGWDIVYAEGEWHVDVTGTDEQLQTLPFAR